MTARARPLRRWRRAALALVLALLAAGCEVSATVDVTVREDGSGVVRLVVTADADAVRAAESGGVPIDQAVRLGDLADAGWDVGAWERAEDGSASIELAKPFESVDQVAEIVQEASGDSGPLRLRATRDPGFLGTEYAVRGRADLEHVTTGVPTDPELLAALTGQAVDPNVIDQQLLAQVKASFDLEVTARLPGSDPQTVDLAPGGVTPIDASVSMRNTTRLALLGAALVLALLATLLWVRGGRRRRRPPRGTARGGPRGGGPGRRGPSRRPRVPHPHLPHPHVPHPDLPPRAGRRAGQPGAPPPPPRRPPMIPPGMT